jgi:aspartyl-tRNA synthetase
MRSRYGVLGTNTYTQWQGNDWKDLSELSAKNEGQTIVFRARVHTLRKIGSKMVFLVFRQQLTTMQAVLSAEANVVSAHMVHYASRLNLEDIVTVKGIVQRPQVLITGASITDAEVRFSNEVYLYPERLIMFADQS